MREHNCQMEEVTLLLVRNSHGIDYFTKVFEDMNVKNHVESALEVQKKLFTFCNAWGENTTIDLSTKVLEITEDANFNIGWNTSHYYEMAVRKADGLLIHVTPWHSFEDSLKELKDCVNLMKRIHQYYEFNFDISTYPIVLLVSETASAKELPGDAKEFANQLNSQIFLLSEKDNDNSTESLVYLLHRIPRINIQTKNVKKECTIN